MQKNSKIKRIMWRVPFRFLHWLFSFTNFLNSRIWMAFYIPLLRTFGMKLNGTPRYISPKCYFDTLSNIELGDHVAISQDTVFLTHDYFLTYALNAIGEKPETDVAMEGTIVLEDNVAVGLNVIILPNTRIGAHSIIGAGSVVRGNIPPYSVVRGNPAEVIGDIRRQGRWAKMALHSKSVRHD